MAANVVLLTLWVELAVLLQIPFCICDRVQLLCLCLKPVNTTRVNAADINDRVTALKSDRSHNNPNKAGFFEEFEVNCSHRLFRVFFCCFLPHLPPFVFTYVCASFLTYFGSLSKLSVNLIKQCITMLAIS